MASVTLELDRKLTEYVAKLTPKMRQSLRRRLERLAPMVAATARAKVPKRSGRLMASISSDTYSTRTGEWGKVSADAKYAHFTEAGFHGWETMRAHYRLIKQAFGRPISPTSALIRTHARMVDAAGDDFLKRALAEAAPYIRSELTDAIDQAIRE